MASLHFLDAEMRPIVYAGGLFPTYILVAFVSQRSWKQPWVEAVVLTLLLFAQSVAIVTTEFFSDVMHFGMLGIHLTYVFSFSPLPAGVIQGMAAIDMALFLFLRWRKHLEDPDAYSKCFLSSSDRCVDTAGEMPLVLDLLVPVIICIYQAALRFRRELHVRLDVLLSQQVDSHKHQLRAEAKKCEDLLTSMLPRKIVSLLKADERVEPQLFEEVTVIFVDVCDFNRLCGRLDPDGVVELLNSIFSELDVLGDLLHVYKVETVMQIYMAVVGCPVPVKNHADVAAHFALAAQGAMPALRSYLAGIGLEDEKVEIRIGLNSGRIRAGVVGLDKPRFKLFGDTVNCASRMETTCLPGRNQINATVKDRLSSGFALEDRGEINIKGKGMMNTWFLTGFNPDMCLEELPPGFVQVHMGSDIQRATSFEMDDHMMSALKSVRSIKMETGGSVNGKQVGMQLNLTQKLKGLVEHGPAGFDFRADEINNAIVEPHSFLLRRWEDFWYALVPETEKTPLQMKKLQLDYSEYEEDTLQRRISATRYITIVWQTLLVTLSGLEQLTSFQEDRFECRLASFLRSMGITGTGLVFLLVLSNSAFFRQHYKRITQVVLLIQCASFLVQNIILYRNDPPFVLLFGGYVMSLPVCDFGTRLAVNTIVMIVFVIAAVDQCSFNAESGPMQEILYIVVFFTLLAMGVRLEEHYAHTANYEQRQVARRMDEMNQARASGAQLLDNLLPPHVARLVSEGCASIAEHHRDVTIIFTDIKGFTAYSSQITPIELVELLNAMYSAFDEIIVNWGLHKVEIIGDAYFVSSGCPVNSSATEPDEHAMRAVEVSLALLRALPGICEDASIKMRVGLHSGDVVAGVVGKKGPRYQLFGPTVHMAEQMESHGIPGRVHISDYTHALLMDGGHEYEFEERSIQLHGEGEYLQTWLVNKSRSRAALQIQKELIRQRQAAAQGNGHHLGYGGGGDLASPNASRSGYDPDYDPEEGANDRRTRRASAAGMAAAGNPGMLSSPMSPYSHNRSMPSTLKPGRGSATTKSRNPFKTPSDEDGSAGNHSDVS
mmetsp:Transcript_9283/g.20729  ORF Transcript_9283/g.20729 Transcript_9283/m.20729 type:complete len:1057 (-) Transcript_9283:187-3357(-)